MCPLLFLEVKLLYRRPGKLTRRRGRLVGRSRRTLGNVLAVAVMVLGSVPIAVFEALPIVVASWFLEVSRLSRSWKYTYR